MWSTTTTVAILFLSLFGLTIGESPVKFSPQYSKHIKPKILEDTINSSVECVRGILSTGLSEYNVPSFNPLVVPDFDIDFDKLNFSIISGKLKVKNGVAYGITSWKMTSLEGSLILTPPTYTVNFGLHYDEVYSTADYKINITVLGHNVIWGEGQLFSGVVQLDAAGHVKGVINDKGVELIEFEAPINLEKYTLNITGLYGDEEISQKFSELISQFVTKTINNNPDIFTKIISPMLIYFFNALVHDEIGVGIVKTMVQKCILDIINTPL